MDDPKSTPDLPPNGSGGIASKADAPTDRETVATDRIRQRFLDLKQFERVGVLASPLPKILTQDAMSGTAKGPEASEPWPLTLHDALRIGLDNAATVRVIAGAQDSPIGGFAPASVKTGTFRHPNDARPAPIMIERLNAEVSSWRFLTEVMAHVRSVEQQYWVLACAMSGSRPPTGPSAWYRSFSIVKMRSSSCAVVR